MADDGGFGQTANILITKHRAAAHGPIADLRVIWRFAHDLRVPIQAVRQHLFAVAHFGTDCHHIFYSCNRLGILDGQRRRTAPASAHRAAGEIAGKHRDDTFTQTGNLIFDLFRCAACQTDRADDSSYPDDDAKHRQQRTHLVPSQRAPGDPD